MMIPRQVSRKEDTVHQYIFSQFFYFKLCLVVQKFGNMLTPTIKYIIVLNCNIATCVDYISIIFGIIGVLKHQAYNDSIIGENYDISHN